MNILYLCADPGIPIRGHKGASVHVRALTDAFSAFGHQVTLVTPRPGPADGPTPNARLIEVASSSYRKPKVPLRWAKLGISETARQALAVAEAIYWKGRELLAHSYFDFIYERYSLWSDTGARLSHEMGVPLVVEVNAPLRLEAARYRALSEVDAEQAAEIEKNLFTAAASIAVVSGPLRDYVVAQGVRAEYVHVLPNAVDERLFHPAVDGNLIRLGLNLTDKFVVGFVGTVKPWHDLDTLIAAIAQLCAAPSSTDKMGNDHHLLLVGDIPDPVRASIAQQGLSSAATIVGPVSHEQVPSYIAAMDVAVSPHPPLADFYFSPLKLFEYLACGLATVAAAVPPVAEIVDDGVTSLLYPPGNAAALAEGLATLAADTNLRKRLGWQGAAHVLRQHTWQGNARQIINWLFPSSRNSESGILEQRAKGEGPIFDDKLRRRLYSATRADVAERLLAAYLTPTNEPAGLPVIANLKVLKYKPRRRCVIAYELTSTDPGMSRRIIGKVFRDERGARLFELQQALWNNRFGLESRDGITVAEPLAYIPEMRMFVQEFAPGLTLDSCLDMPDFVDRVCLSAAAIAKLHSCHVQPTAEYTLTAELNNLDHWADDLILWRPDCAQAFVRQLAGLREAAAKLLPANFAPTHRDFYYSQILFADRRMTLIDLDMFTLADPAIDVANFAAHLRFLALQRLSDPHGLDEMASLFIEEYARRRQVSPEFYSRLAFYEAATLFRLMHVTLQRPQFEHCFGKLFNVCNDLILLTTSS